MDRTAMDRYLKLEYPVSFQKTEEGYEAWHPDFGRSAIIGFGKSLSQALRVLNRSRAVFIEYLAEEGLEIPEPTIDDGMEAFSGRFMLRVPKDLHARLAREAHRNGVSLNSYVIHLLSERNGTNGSGKEGNGKAGRKKKAVARALDN